MANNNKIKVMFVHPYLKLIKDLIHMQIIIIIIDNKNNFFVQIIIKNYNKILTTIIMVE